VSECASVPLNIPDTANMSDSEMRNEVNPKRADDSDSSSDEEGPIHRRGRRDSSPDVDEGLHDSSPEGEDQLQDSTPSSSLSSAPKVEAVSNQADTDTDDDLEKDRKDYAEEDEDKGLDNVEDMRKEINKVDQAADDEEDELDDEENNRKEDSSDTEDEREAEIEDTNDGCVSSKTTKAEEDTPSPCRSPSPAPGQEEDRSRSASPAHEDRSRSVSPVRQVEDEEEEDRSRSASPARKSSHGSSSYEEERASSMSPEPSAVISAPKADALPTTPKSSHKDITKIYTEALVNENDLKNGSSPFAEKIPRGKPIGDITQIYTASLQKEHQSPKLERARGGKPVKDITQLYTQAFNKPDSKLNDMPSPNRPRRNDNITKLYTGGFENKTNFKSKPNDEITNPRKHNMATSLDKEGIRDAYTSVMSDNNGIEWAAFKFDEQNQLVVSGTGEEFSQFKSQFGPDDRGFGYIKIQTGDEMSKRSRFVLVTWVGGNVSVMKKAKMSTDRLLVKEIIQNLSVELQLENAHELSLDHLKAEVDKAGGARYGTGVRDM